MPDDGLYHHFSSVKIDDPKALAAGKVVPSEWNHRHVVVGPPGALLFNDGGEVGVSDKLTFDPLVGDSGTLTAPDVNVLGFFGVQGLSGFLGLSLFFADSAYPSTSVVLGDDTLTRATGLNGFEAGALNIRSGLAASGAYTLANSGIVVLDAAGGEIFRIWGTDPDTNNSGAGNLFVGNGAGFGFDATVAGAGYSNVGVGGYALGSLTSGFGNVAIGEGAGYSLADGAFNVVVGSIALYSGVSGWGNAVFGAGAVSSLVTGDYNTAMGVFALSQLTGGVNNVAIGTGAGAGEPTRVKQVPPFRPVFRSGVDGSSILDSDMVFVGYSAARDSAAVGTPMVNGIAIGSRALVGASNTAVIGNADVTDVYFGSTAGLAAIHAKYLTVAGDATDALQVVPLQQVVGMIAAIPMPPPTNPAGANKEVQINNGGAFGAATGFTFDNATRTLALAGQSVVTPNTTPILDLSTTWNTSGSPTAIKLNVTNTLSGAASKLLDLQVGGANICNVNKAGMVTVGVNPGAYTAGLSADYGALTFVGYIYFNCQGYLSPGAASHYFDYNGIVSVHSGGTYGWSATGNAAGVGDLLLSRGAAATLQQGRANSATPVNQTLQAQGSRAGTDVNIAGADYTIQSGIGTGNSAMSALIFKSPVLVASGSGAQSMYEAFRVNNGSLVLPISNASGYGNIRWSSGGNTIAGPSLYNDGSGIYLAAGGYQQVGLITSGATGLALRQIGMVMWSSSYANGANDVALARNAAGVVEINNGTAGQFRDLIVRNLTPSGKIELPNGDANNPSLRFAADGPAVGWFGGSNAWSYSSGSGGVSVFTIFGGSGINALNITNGFKIGFAAGDSRVAGSDTALMRNAAGVVEINNGTAGQFRDLKLRNIIYGAPAADGTASGPTTSDYNAGYTTAVGDLMYLDAAATWQQCDANTSYDGMPGIALEVKTAGQAVKVALPGSTVWAAARFPTFTVGGPVYMSETAGDVTQTKPPTTDSATRVMGWAVHADKMYFFPEPSYVTHV